MDMHPSLGNSPQGLLYLSVSRQLDGQAPGNTTKACKEKKFDLTKWIYSGSGMKDKSPIGWEQQQRK